MIKARIIISFLLLFGGIFTAHGGILIMNGLTHEMQLTPGGKFRGGIEIQNNSDKPEAVKLYQTDYLFNAEGESKYDETGSHARSNGHWITVNSLFITLGPKETRIIEFEVTAPEKSDLTGTYWSIIMVEGIAPPDTTKTQKGVSINTVLRYAIQVISHIGSTGSQDLQFTKLNMVKENGNLLQVDIENSGERAVRPEVSLELFNENGVSQGIIQTDPKRIYPGTSIRSSLKLDVVKPGKYSGILVAKCDEEHIFGTNIDIEL